MHTLMVFNRFGSTGQIVRAVLTYSTFVLLQVRVRLSVAGNKILW